jgi:hypothetical protein
VAEPSICLATICNNLELTPNYDPYFIHPRSHLNCFAAFSSDYSRCGLLGCIAATALLNSDTQDPARDFASLFATEFLETVQLRADVRAHRL